MKEATGEGSMTIVTIVIIAALVAAAAIVVGIMMSKANQATDDVDDSVEITVCPHGQTLGADGTCQTTPTTPH